MPCGTRAIRRAAEDRPTNGGIRMTTTTTTDDVDSFDLDEKYKWIPRKVFESACFTDANDQ